MKAPCLQYRGTGDRFNYATGETEASGCRRCRGTGVEPESRSLQAEEKKPVEIPREVLRGILR